MIRVGNGITFSYSIYICVDRYWTHEYIYLIPTTAGRIAATVD